MTSLLSFSWRRTQQINYRQTNIHDDDDDDNIPTDQLLATAVDPWGLGIATSTSSADSLALPNNHGSGEEAHYSTLERVRTVPLPTTPEGLRPRKSIQKLREELLGYPLCRELSPTPFGHSSAFKVEDLELKKASTVSNRPYRSQKGLATKFTCEPAELPPILHCHRESPQTTLQSSLYMSGNHDDYEHEEMSGDEDDGDDIVSVIGSPSLSRHSCRKVGPVAASPDLNPGKAKTAVGAVLAAMTAEQGTDTNNYQATDDGSQHSILPTRDWMDMDDKDFVVGEENNVFRQFPNDDDQDSSLHASPSSNVYRPSKFSSWTERQQQFLQDTSFTRNILSRDPNASWQQGHGKNHEPYDFDHILSEEEESMSLKDSMGAPRVLDLINDNGGLLNVSAISSSYHPRDMMSLHSLADTIEDDIDEIVENNEIDQYQPLIDEMMQPGEASSDDVLLLMKADNQRRIKEQLLLSTLERMCDDVDLLKEVSGDMERSGSQCPSQRNSLLLGLSDSQQAKIIHQMEFLLTKWSVDSPQDKQVTERLALRFCFMVLQKPTLSSRSSKDSAYAPRHHWKPLPGLRAALGLEEDPASPQSVRGGDSSLFSLPSDSACANDDTPHTSNVSMTTTITTIISPEKIKLQGLYQSAGLRKTFETMTRLLCRLEDTCLLLLTVREKVKTADEIRQIYFEFLQLPVLDLKCILHFFEMHYEYPPLSSTARRVSEDYEEQQDNSCRSQLSSTESLAFLPYVKRVSSRDDSNFLSSHQEEVLHIKIVENEPGDSGQEVECGLWTPNSDEMNSYVPLNDDGPGTIATVEGNDSSDEEERGPIEDLRRTVGSFDDLRRTVDLESVQEEREDTPSEDDFDEDQYEAEILNEPDRINGTRRNHVADAASRWKRRGFWKSRIMGSRQRRFSSAE